MDKYADLLRFADQSLDEYRFSEAREAYRKLLEQGQISSAISFNYQTAEREERLQFWKGLAAQFPEKMEYQFALTHCQIERGLAMIALETCTRHLTGDLPPKQRILWRLERMQAAVKSRSFDTFAEDFLAVWHEVAPRKPRLRILAGVVIGLTRIEAIEALKPLATREWDGSKLGELIVAKCTELALFQDVHSDIDDK